MIAYLKNLLIALDQFAGAMLFGIHADMTISAQAWLWHMQGKRHWPYRLIDRMFWWDPRHCYESYRGEVEGKQLPNGVRTISQARAVSRDTERKR